MNDALAILFKLRCTSKMYCFKLYNRYEFNPMLYGKNAKLIKTIPYIIRNINLCHNSQISITFESIYCTNMATSIIIIIKTNKQSCLIQISIDRNFVDLSWI